MPSPSPNPYANAPRLPDPIEDLGALVGVPGKPVELEIGPGRGGFALERLLACSDAHLIGLEIKRKWATLVDERLRARGLGSRGRVFCEDVRLALPRIPSGSVSIAYFHFPDPWWKKRHQKRLVLTPSVVAELARVIVAGGELFVQTDVQERANAYQAIIDLDPHFRRLGDSVLDNPYRAMSPRERRAVRDGLPIFRLKYTRC